MPAQFSRRRALVWIVALPGFLLASREISATPNGTFIGRVVTEWMPDGRRMRLVEPFEYVDPTGRRWPVPAGAIVDGASIPRVFWPIIGGPFEGLYRAPSVIHDYYCENRTRAFADVHRVFYDAMLCAEVLARTARLMYEAVARFGPRWSDPKIDPACEIVDENYDFERCARNSAPPPVEFPKTGEAELLAFAEEMAPAISPEELSALRSSIAAAR